VRILFSFVGGRGHVEPLLPLARAARAAGHTVAFAGRHSRLAVVEAHGFDFLPVGPHGHNEPPQRRPLLELDQEREERDVRERFIRDAARERATTVLALYADWRPDVVVCDQMDFGGLIAAERRGLPYATVLVLAAGSALVRPEVVAEPLDELRAEHGLPPDPEAAMNGRYLVLSPFPPTLRDPEYPLPATAQFYRAISPEPAEAEPPWPTRPNDALNIYFTLGTVFNLESGDLFSRVLEGLSDLPINVVATLGPHIGRDEFQPLPDNIHLEQFIPQSQVLPHCDVVVSHGGSGSVLGALAHGLPSVLLPMGADQPLNAARCEELGVARVLDAVRTTPKEVHESVSAVLSTPSYRAAAERMRDEIAALPDPSQAVARLERLPSAGRPDRL
jgi:UDP:flavonoid glycosyltransferase YjiC (YdhE family)